METRELLDPQLASKAIKAIYDVGPRVYGLTGLSKGPLHILAFGCQGNGGEDQMRAAELMDKRAAAILAENPHANIIMTGSGDNVYKNGSATPNDLELKRKFHDIYRNEKLTTLKKIPCFIVLGNHDEYRHAIAEHVVKTGWYPQGAVYGKNQVAHTYYAEETKQAKLIELFKQNTLSIHDLPPWIMPYFFYSLIVPGEHTDTQIFFLNSNSYVMDYYNFITGKPQSDKEAGDINQAAWFESAYNEAVAAGRQVIVVKHNPFVVSGKRSFPAKYDSSHYLPPHVVIELNEKLHAMNPNHITTHSYNELEACIYRQQNIQPALIVVAHEHALISHNKIEFPKGHYLPPQITTGGGGGDLEPRASYRNHPNVGAHQQHNGFWHIKVDLSGGNQLKYDMYTTTGIHLRMKPSSHLPFTKHHPDPQVMQLRNCVLTACDQYFNRLKEKELHPAPVEAHGMLGWAYGAASKAVTDYYYRRDPREHHENAITQDIQAFFNQRHLPDYKTALKQLHDFTRKLPHRTSKNNELPFYTLLKIAIIDSFHKSLKELYKENENPNSLNFNL